jgi:hypothetical protein
MTTTDADLDYPGSYERVVPESDLEGLALEKLIRSELPRTWQGRGVYIRTIDDEGRVQLMVSQLPSQFADEGASMNIDLSEYEGTAYLLKTPGGQVKVGWTLSVGGDEQSNLLPHEPALIS